MVLADTGRKNATISLDLFRAINPSINANCTNLFLGTYYCVSPVAGWNGTSVTSTIATPAAPTPSGTTSKVSCGIPGLLRRRLTYSQCYYFYTIQKGDTYVSRPMWTVCFPL